MNTKKSANTDMSNATTKVVSERGKNGKPKNITFNASIEICFAKLAEKIISIKNFNLMLVPRNQF